MGVWDGVCRKCGHAEHEGHCGLSSPVGVSLCGCGEMVSVPAEKIAALREAVRKHPGPHMGDVTYIVEAAWDLVVPAHDWIDDPATTSDEKLARFRSLNPEPTRGPSPARDDAEKAIVAVLNLHDVERLNMSSVDCTCGWTFEPTPKPGHVALIRAHTAHVASVIAAHMAAPDELTDAAGRTPLERTESALRGCGEALETMRAERDALRERIRALADEWGPQSDDGPVRMVIDCANAADALRAALGDS